MSSIGGLNCGSRTLLRANRKVNMRFFMDRYAEDNRAELSAFDSGWGRGKRPVINVSRYDAKVTVRVWTPR